MFLTRSEIKKAHKNGDITVHPFIEKHISPNSIDVTLNETLLVYDFSQNSHLDMKSNNPTDTIIIPEDGYILQPNTLYIGMTNETATSHKYIPMFEGRSSIGRLGINTHITAGFGDIGWGFEETESGMICHNPTWTLEICTVHPVKIYPNIRVGQVYFVQPKGDIEYYSGKYGCQRSPQPSRSFADFL